MKTSISISILTAGLFVAVSAPVYAQSGDASGECTTDADCPDSYICETYEWDACPSCEQGGECPPCQTGSDSVCVPPPPQECDADSPCSGNDVCVSYTFESCSGSVSPGCAPGESCPDPAPPTDTECTASTESYCVPPYLAPCSADADCGGGFTCEAVEVCVCSGGGSSGVPGEDPPEPTEPDCSCDTGSENYCRLIEVECTSDGDCDGELTCQDIYGGESTPTIACIDGEDCPPPPEPVDPVSNCAPVSYGYYGGADGGGYGESVATATGHSDANVSSSEREEFFPVDGTDGDGSSKESPSSCSTAGGGSGGTLFLLLAGLLLGRRRRRS